MTPDRNLPLFNRNALITGVSRRRGIGFAIANRLAEHGADLFLQSWSAFDASQPWGRDPNGAAALAHDLRRYGHRVAVLETDLRDPEAPQLLIDSASVALGHLDILVANHAHSTAGTLEDLTVESIDAHLLVNVRATLMLIKCFAARHDGRPGGRIIMMTSGQHRDAMPAELAYVASKGALHQLTRSIAAHLAPRGIAVNTINPGATDTGYATRELHQLVKAAQPQGRWGQPDDAARLIAWLTSDEAAWISGEVINSTGGGP